MKYFFIPALLLFVMFSCDNADSGSRNKSRADTTERQSDTIMMEEEREKEQKVYANKAFRNIQVEKSGEKQWSVTGEARVFEGSFSYYIEEGHIKLAAGNIMADKGAPAWGNFSFRVEADSIPKHSHPHLVLYEASAKDGRPVNELAIPLNK